MLVRDIMTKEVVTVTPDTTIAEVQALMERRNIRHFPILEEQGAEAHLVGIVSDRDIRSVGSQHPKAKKGVTLEHPIRNIMVYPVLTAHPLDPIEDSAKTLREHKIGAMPVMEDDQLVGIVTGIDFLEALVRMTGAYEAASRIDIEMENRPGTLAEVARAIGEQGVNISSVLTSHHDSKTITFAFRVNTIEARRLATDLRRAGFRVVWPPEKL